MAGHGIKNSVRGIKLVVRATLTESYPERGVGSPKGLSLAASFVFIYMKGFKKAAYKILSESKEKCLHSNDITKRAIDSGILKTAGKTPELTMNSLLTTDINENEEKSIFKKCGPSKFGLNRSLNNRLLSDALSDKIYRLSKNVSSKQKGNIGESRVAELITLYGSDLSCYKPLADDEGIDLIVRNKKNFKTYHLQIKTRFGANADTSLIAHVKANKIRKDKAMGLVFCFFDTEDGDIWDYLWLVPAKSFARLAKLSNNKKLGRIYKFIAGRSKKDTNKWNKFLIDKRELGNKISEFLKNI